MPLPTGPQESTLDSQATRNQGEESIPWVRLGGFLATSALAFWLGFFFFEIESAVNVVRLTGYSVLAIALGGFVFFGFRLALIHWNRIKTIYAHPAAWITILGLGWLVFANQPLGYRTVMDEIIISGTSQQLHLERQPLVPRSAFSQLGELKVDRSFLDKRPFFYPFLVSILHDTTGYRAENAFFLNVALSIGLLFLAWGVGFALAGTPGGIFSTVLLGTLPLIPMMGSGGGFEIANTLFIVLFFASACTCLKWPDSNSISFLILSTVLLSHLRYESAMFVPFAGILIFLAWRKAGRLIVPPALIAAPLLLIILPLQQQLFEAREKFWQLDDVEGADTVFSFRYLPDNLGHALNYFLSGEKFIPTSILLFSFGCCGIVYAAIHLRGWFTSDRPTEKAMAIFWCALLLQTGLILTYFWGQLDDPIIHRLSFPIWIWFWISTLFCFRGWLRKTAPGFALLSIAIGTFLLISMPLYASRNTINHHSSPSVFNMTSQWADKNLSARSMVLTKTSPFWISKGIPSFAPARSEAAIDLIQGLLDRKVYEGVYVFERTKFEQGSGDFIAMSSLPIRDLLEMELLWELHADKNYGARVFRVIAINSFPPEGEGEGEDIKSETGSRIADDA